MFKTCHVLKNRFVVLMNRKVGCMRDSHAMIQHLNPACRAARLFPQLPISRLIISLNDYDVPRFKVGTHFETDLKDVLNLGMRDAYRPLTSANTIDPFEYFQEKVFQVVVATWVLFKATSLYLFTALPSSLQDAILELCGALFINLLALSFYLLGRVVAALAAVLAVLLLLALYLKETTAWRQTEIYRIVRDSAPYLVKNLTVVKQKKKFEEMSSDFDSRVLFKSNFTLLDSEIVKVDSIYEKRKNKYAQKSKTQVVVQPSSPSAVEEQMTNPALVTKPAVAPTKDVQRNISLYTHISSGTSKALVGTSPLKFGDGFGEAKQMPKLVEEVPTAVETVPAVKSVPRLGLGHGEEDSVVSFGADKKQERSKKRDVDDSARSRDRDGDERRKKSKDHKRSSSRSRDRDRPKDEDSDGESGRRRAALKSKKRLNRLSQEIAALQLQVSAEIQEDEPDSDVQSLASMSARSKQQDGQGQGQMSLERRHRNKRREVPAGPGEGGGLQRQLHQQLQQQLQQRSATSNSLSASQSQSPSQGDPGSGTSAQQGSALGGVGTIGPGFGTAAASTSMRFNNSFDPLAASGRFQQQQQRQQRQINPSNPAEGSTRSQFPSWH